MLTLLLTLNVLATEPVSEASPTPTFAQLTAQLDAHQLALERVTRWRLRDDLEPTQALCLHSRNADAQQLVAAARALEVRLELEADSERRATDLRAFAAAEERVATSVTQARSCLTCGQQDPNTSRCETAAFLSMEANDLQGHRWRTECSMQDNYVCREVRDGCVCTEATLDDWIGG